LRVWITIWKRDLLFIDPAVLAVAAQEPLFSHYVSFTATVRTIFLLFSVKSMIDAMVTGFVIIRIHPSTPLAVPTLFLLWLFGHFMIGTGQVKIDI
jgi:hypothetical protein